MSRKPSITRAKRAASAVAPARTARKPRTARSGSGGRTAPYHHGALHEALLGLSPSRLTITFGFGAGLFSKNGVDRYGLASRRPVRPIGLQGAVAIGDGQDARAQRRPGQRK